jgi:RNA polymerase sigma factor (sigma-70 family)
MQNLKNLTLEQLTIRAIEGDIEARALLIEHPAILQLLDRVSSWAYQNYKQYPDEIKDFIRVKLFNSISTLKDPSHLNKWCYMLVRNYCLNQIRHLNVEESYQKLIIAKHEGQFGKLHGKSLPPPHPASSPEEQMLIKEQIQQEELLIEELRLNVREVLERLLQSSPDSSLIKAWAEGKTPKQISEETGISIKTVFRQLKKMQKAIVTELYSQIETIRGQMQLSRVVIEDEKMIAHYILEGLRDK